MNNWIDSKNFETNSDHHVSGQHFTENKLLESRTIMLSDAVTSKTAKTIITNLLLLDQMDNKRPIYFYVNSPGGEVNSGFAIYDTIRFIESDVYIINSGLCASIATIINVATKREHRLSLPNTRFLIHQPLISGQVVGQASDLEITAIQITKTREKINAILAEECGQPLEKLTQDTLRDYWMDASQALEYGLVTRIISSKKDLL